MANKWFLLTTAKNGKPTFQPQRGAYPHNIWERAGLSGGGYFSIGCGVAADKDVRDALLWYYDAFGFKAADEKAGTPYDTPSPYPHHAVLAFVNWPVGEAPKDPNGVIPNAVHDAKWGFYAWRDKWQDETDVAVSILTKPTRGNYGCKAESALSILQNGKVTTWGNFRGGFKGEFRPTKNGSTVLETADGCLAIDFSGASGASCMIAVTGSAAGKSDQVVTVGETKVTFLFLGKGKPATPALEGDAIAIGRQTVTVDGKMLKLGV
jgi:hypothetical protein